MCLWLRGLFLISNSFDRGVAPGMKAANCHFPKTQVAHFLQPTGKPTGRTRGRCGYALGCIAIASFQVLFFSPISAVKTVCRSQRTQWHLGKMSGRKQDVRRDKLRWQKICQPGTELLRLFTRKHKTLLIILKNRPKKIPKIISCSETHRGQKLLRYTVLADLGKPWKSFSAVLKVTRLSIVPRPCGLTADIVCERQRTFI